MMSGATLPNATWSWPAVLATAAGTGVVAGSILGLVLSVFVVSLDEPPSPAT
jgi:hypothetical protein